MDDEAVRSNIKLLVGSDKTGRETCRYKSRPREACWGDGDPGETRDPMQVKNKGTDAHATSKPFV